MITDYNYPRSGVCVCVCVCAALTSTHNLCFEQKYEKYQNFLSENFICLVVKFKVYLNRRVFVMKDVTFMKLSPPEPSKRTRDKEQITTKHLPHLIPLARTNEEGLQQRKRLRTVSRKTTGGGGGGGVGGGGNPILFVQNHTAWESSVVSLKHQSDAHIINTSLNQFKGLNDDLKQRYENMPIQICLKFYHQKMNFFR